MLPNDNDTGMCRQQTGPGGWEERLFVKLADGVMRPGGLRLTRRLVDCCAFAQGVKVVDVGCGTGITVEYLGDICRLDAAGADVAEELLAQARERAPHLRLIAAAGEELPFGNASVAGVLAECSLSVMQDAGRVIAECRRILAPGGKLAITDLYIRDADSSRLPGRREKAGCVSGVLTYAELTRLLAENGFTVTIWEDQSAYLKEFVAKFIIEHGSLERLWQCMAARTNNRPIDTLARLGYFLLVAEKC